MSAISYDDALARIAGVAAVAGRERVPLAQAHGRVLAETVLAGADQPPFDRATMDGYAFVPDAQRTVWTVAGTVLAGQVADPPAPGACWRIMTGAPVPAGCTVVPVEQTDGGRERMTVPAPIAAIRNVALRGEDARAGAVVAQPGLALTPAAIAALAMAGADTVAVAAQPRVRILTSGDEVGAGGPAGIRDTNGPFLAAWCAALGWSATPAPLADDPVAVRAALAEDTDLIITTGGVSMGDRDLIPGALRDLGAEVLLHGVDMQPGKPVLLARRGATWIVGLPGNPVSVIATAHLVLLPLLVRLGWAAPRPWLELPLTAPAAAKARRLFLPGRLVPGGVAPVAWNGSGDGYAAAYAHGLLDLPAGARLAAGERVRFLPYLGTAVGVGTELPR
jgi:molybdopterin molybdotransferase